MAITGTLVITGLFFALFLPPFYVFIRALKLRLHYRLQGIAGPPFRPFIGNLPEIRHFISNASPHESSPFETASSLRVAPEFCSFFHLYGKVSVHELGSTTRLVIADAELVRLVLVTKASYYQKSDLSREILSGLLGKGVTLSEGNLWKQQRRILSPAFRVEHLKGMFKHMYAAGQDLVDRWTGLIQQSESGTEVEIEMYEQMSITTLDVITRTSFSMDVSTLSSISSVLKCISQTLTYRLQHVYTYKRLLPGHSVMPTVQNWRLKKQQKCINELMVEIIEKSLSKHAGSAAGHDPDFLSVMMSALLSGSPTMSMSQLIDECKTIFVAGHATTALLLTWILVMLSKYPHWQQRAREEVVTMLGDSQPYVEDLPKLETINLIILETLRLYPPVVSVARTCLKEHQIGKISVLPHTTVMIPIILLHQMEDIWGADAAIFNPQRFKSQKNVAEATAFMPFGGGPRVCLGLNFALMEVKVLLASMLRNFRFTLSSSYVHAPGNSLSMKPIFGAPLVVQLI